jgi:hypothetical protein
LLSRAANRCSSRIWLVNIEQRLAEAIQSFGLDALAGAVPLRA